MSVIIPTYDRREYVCQAIDSVLAQTFTAHEIIVVDDGSTDETGSLLRSRYGERIHYVYQDNRGEAAARNVAIRHSCGHYIALLDSDDVWMPSKLEKQVGLLERRAEVGLVSCYALRIDAQGHLVSAAPTCSDPVPDPVPLPRLIVDSPLHASTVVVRRACLDEVGWFCESIRYGEDRDLCLRVASRYQIGFVQEALVGIRWHGKSQTNLLMTREEAERRLADRLLVNDRVFSTFRGDAGKLADLKARAQAIEYGTRAFSFYLCGDDVRGSALLARAIELDPATWLEDAHAAEGICNHALALANATGAAEAIQFVKHVCDHLPAALVTGRARFRRRVLGRFHIALTFAQHRRGAWSLVRRHLLTGIAYSPSWLLNRGVLSIAVEALVGPRLARNSRRIYRNFSSVRRLLSADG